MAEQNRARLVWQGGMRFAAESGSGHTVVMEAIGKPGHQGPSPMEYLLMGVAGCTAIDVAAILEKMRESVTAIEVAVVGERAASHPKRFTAIEITYTVTGHDLSEEKVRRATTLSHEKYCSASASLRQDCAISTIIEVREG